jgi:hypothetical protein
MVVVVANSLGSRCVRYMLDAAMAPSEAARAPVFLLDDPQYAAAHWHQSRSGVKGFMFSWLDLIYAWRHGSDRQTPPPQSVEAYQKMLSDRFGTQPPPARPGRTGRSSQQETLSERLGTRRQQN